MSIKRITNKNYYLIETGNGLRIVFSENKKSDIVHIGYIIEAGSRDEIVKKNGMAHFIEHVVFKGTSKRNSYQVLNRLESVGGEINAYTSRERTCFYSATLKKYTERSIDLLTDIVFNPTFPEKEIEREKRVILEEIEMYKDSPVENIYDKFHNYVFDGNSLGHNILGTSNEIKNFSTKDILEFRNKNYSNNRIVLSIVGNLTIQKVESLVSKYLSQTPFVRNTSKQNSGFNYVPFKKEFEKDFQQTHCILGNIAYSQKDDRKYGLLLLSDILGGDWMSSRLNISIREKYGYVYNINSNYGTYSDTGLFLVQFGTDLKYLDRVINLVLKEFKKLREKRLSDAQLNRAKRQLLGQYAMAEENKSAVMHFQGKNILSYGYVVSKEEFTERIERLTSDDLFEIANKVLKESEISTLVYKNK